MVGTTISHYKRISQVMLVTWVAGFFIMDQELEAQSCTGVYTAFAEPPQFCNGVDPAPCGRNPDGTPAQPCMRWGEFRCSNGAGFVCCPVIDGCRLPAGLPNRFDCAVTCPSQWPCRPGATQSCLTTAGSCGTQQCDQLSVSSSAWGQCNPSLNVGMPCPTGEPGACAAGTFTCQSGLIMCVREQNPTPESCDGVDNNCDGLVDEGNPGGGLPCSTGEPGVCATGTITACQNGLQTCVRSQEPTPEVQDGLDNDCDGEIDEIDPPSSPRNLRTVP